MIDKPPRIALLIDADNSPAAKIDADPQRARRRSARRASGAPTATGRSRSCAAGRSVLHEHAIRPIQQFDYSKGKNASDMAMVIDALDLLYTDRPEAFGIVSSDADFTPLVMHLRAKGARGLRLRRDRRRPSRSSTPARASSILDKLATLRPAQRRCRHRRARDDAAARRCACRPPSCKQDAKLVQPAAQRGRGGGRRERLGARRRGRPADRQPGLVRPAQLRLSRRSPSCSRRPSCSSSTRKERRTSRSAIFGRRARCAQVMSARPAVAAPRHPPRRTRHPPPRYLDQNRLIGRLTSMRRSACRSPAGRARA